MADPDQPSTAVPHTRRSGSFGRLALLGVVSAAVAALASAKTWVSHDLRIDGQSVADAPGASDVGAFPLAGALGLLLLAAWGVLLVTRGLVRRTVGAVTVLVSAGLVACVVVGWARLPGDVRDSLSAQGGPGSQLVLHRTGWFWAAAVASVVSLVVTVLSVRAMPQWPEMGRRYDAPAGSGARGTDASLDPEADPLPLWKAIEAGADPTADPTVDDARPPTPDPRDRRRSDTT